MLKVGDSDIYQIESGDCLRIWREGGESVQRVAIEIPGWIDCSIMADGRVLTDVSESFVVDDGNEKRHVEFVLGEIPQGWPDDSRLIKDAFLVVHVPLAGIDGFSFRPSADDFVFLASTMHTNADSFFAMPKTAKSARVSLRASERLVA